MKIAVLLALSAFAGGTALAEQPGRADPRDPQAKAPAVIYRSAFQDYRSFREQEPVAWREVNDEVARVGGHAGVLKQGGKQ